MPAKVLLRKRALNQGDDLFEMRVQVLFLSLLQCLRLTLKQEGKNWVVLNR